MEEANKKVMKEIKVLKRTKNRNAEDKGNLEKLAALEKKITDLEKQPTTRPRPLITEDDYGLACRSLVLAPIPHRRGATLAEQIEEVKKFMAKMLEMPEDMIDLAEVTRMTRGQDITNEAEVAFVSTSIRDTVSSYRPKLSGKEGKMRIVVPARLKEESRIKLFRTTKQ